MVFLLKRTALFFIKLFVATDEALGYEVMPGFPLGIITAAYLSMQPDTGSTYRSYFLGREIT